MNNNYKYLIWSGTAVLVILALFLLAHMGPTPNTTENTVSFSGEGKVLAKPDIAVISFSIMTEAATSKAAQDDNSKKSQKVTDFLKKQGIDEKDIKTTGYNIYPQYNNNYPKPCPLDVPVTDQLMPSIYPCRGDNTPKISSYQVTQSFEAKVRNLDNASSVLDGLVTAGVNQVYNLNFQIDKSEKLKDQAREIAIKDAKDKANNLRKQLGISLGKIVDFSENGNGEPPMYYEAKAMDAGGRGGAAVEPSVPSGENEVTISVTITYQIK